jgi:cytochrome c oxidase cbb3-type subunit 4
MRRPISGDAMTYETVSRLVQQGGTIYFVLLFLGVLAYAFWPKNKATFDKAARAALDAEE